MSRRSVVKAHKGGQILGEQICRLKNGWGRDEQFVEFVNEPILRLEVTVDDGGVFIDRDSLNSCMV